MCVCVCVCAFYGLGDGAFLNNKHQSLIFHHHHVPEGLGMLSCSLILKMKLVPPSLPRSSYVSSSFWCL